MYVSGLRDVNINNSKDISDFLNVKNIEKNNNLNSISKDVKKEKIKLIDISDEGISKYDYVEKFKKVFHEGIDKGKFIEKTVEEYFNIKDKIDIKKDFEIGILDQALDEALNYGVNYTANKLESFFDGAFNKLKCYKMDSGNEVFNEEKFKENLKPIKEKAFKIIKNYDNKKDLTDLVNKIKDLFPKESEFSNLEDMSFVDMKEALKVIDKSYKFESGQNSKKIQENINKYMERAKDLLKNFKGSKKLKNQFKKVFKRNANTYKKVSVFSNHMKNNKEDIEKFSALIRMLEMQYKSLGVKIKKYMKENDIKGVARILKMQQNLMKEITSLRKDLDSKETDSKELNRNPDSIEKSYEYEQINVTEFYE